MAKYEVDEYEYWKSDDHIVEIRYSKLQKMKFWYWALGVCNTGLVFALVKLIGG